MNMGFLGESPPSIYVLALYTSSPVFPPIVITVATRGRHLTISFYPDDLHGSEDGARAAVVGESV